MDYNIIQNNQQQNSLKVPKFIPIASLFYSLIAVVFPWLLLGIFSIGLIVVIFVCLGIGKRIYCLYLTGLIISTIKNVILSGLILYFVFNEYEFNKITFFLFFLAFALVIMLLTEPFILIKFKNRVKNHCNSNMNEVTLFINNQGMNYPNNPIPNGFNPYLAGQNMPPIIPNSYQDINNPIVPNSYQDMNNPIIPNSYQYMNNPIIPNSYQDMNIPNNITPMKNDINQNNTSQTDHNRNIDEQNNAYQPLLWKI